MPEWLLYQVLRFLTGKREKHSFLMSMTPTGREALLSSGGKMQWVKPLIEVSGACEKWPPGLLSFWRTNSMERKPGKLTSKRNQLLAGKVLPTIGYDLICHISALVRHNDRLMVIFHVGLSYFQTWPSFSSCWFPHCLLLQGSIPTETGTR